MNQLAVRENSVMQVLELDAIKTQLTNLLEGNEKKLESFKTKILKISLSKMLMQCSPESIINCGLQALTLNLPLEAGQGYVVNYNGVACFDSGYKGWQVLAKRAGFSVIADIVYRCDKYSQTGIGHKRTMIFEPDFSNRHGSNDEWAKENLSGVIVSVLDTHYNVETNHFVSGEMIFKITGMSPSVKSPKGRKHSPHENWAEQMFCAKAIKQVLTKFAIDLDTSTDLKNAIEIVTESEVQAQKVLPPTREYPAEKFDKFYPEWENRVRSGKSTAESILTLLNNNHDLNDEQVDAIQNLKQLEPIQGEIYDAE
jgi:recombination protein RecT